MIGSSEQVGRPYQFELNCWVIFLTYWESLMSLIVFSASSEAYVAFSGVLLGA